MEDGDEGAGGWLGEPRRTAARQAKRPGADEALS